MLLEVLKLVGGLAAGGPPALVGGALAVLVLLAVRSIATGPGGGGVAPGGGPPAEPGGDMGGAPKLWLAARGGALARPVSAAPAVAGGEAGLALTERGVEARGGGGVGFLACSSAPAALLTQRLSSGS